ncbi:hypothetical protein TVAG_139250 [Trichomonas vaginalis G3]|uniref:Uncharacterized protein n=1 Tax=Trichomonas vaginalis (strain ATCC PRA-98 / G3) TaxID=412133 RepID=A2E499_TRIV3|nr:hypothetical protein TVAGG3_0252240 [Trichomonas vaginalis G3]EAY12545.1 hypothetical protein TVAG_139250 [Trichomonas vaginalis G3]KAI5554087.1 hypothetical protein TVAGG3_0252240 [Trichomonas vaginalis G3]|eukprot:XP_001324768.1 hypothetical protein [Trichomonas vaginalis G3]
MSKAKSIQNSAKNDQASILKTTNQRFDIISNKIEKLLNNPKLNQQYKSQLLAQLSKTKQLKINAEEKIKENNTNSTDYVNNSIDSLKNSNDFDKNQPNSYDDATSDEKFESMSSPFEYETKQQIQPEQNVNKTTIDEITNQVFQLQSKIDIIKSQNDQLKLQILDEKEKSEKLEKENQNLNELNDNFRYLNENLQTQVQELNERLKASAIAVETSIDTSSYDKQIKKLQEENDQLKMQLQASQEQIKQFSQNSQNLESLFIQVKKKSEIIAKKNVHLKKMLSESQSMLENNSKFNEIENKVKELENDNSKLKEENATLRSQLGLDESKNERKKLELIESLIETSKSMIDSDDISFSDEEGNQSNV